MSDLCTTGSVPRRSALLHASDVQVTPARAAIDSEFPSESLLRSVREAVLHDRPVPLPEESRQGPRLNPADRLLLEAREIHGRAKQREAESLVLHDQAMARAAEVERDAYHKGYQQGEQAGLEMGQAKMAPMLAEISALLMAIRDAHGQVVEANRSQLVELACAVATRLLHRELEQSPDQIMTTLEEVLGLIGQDQRVKLRLSQVDFQHLLNHQNQIPALSHLGDRVTFEIDPQMVRGGCLVQTSTGQIDATIETMYGEMRRTLSNPERVREA